MNAQTFYIEVVTDPANNPTELNLKKMTFYKEKDMTNAAESPLFENLGLKTEDVTSEVVVDGNDNTDKQSSIQTPIVNGLPINNGGKRKSRRRIPHKKSKRGGKSRHLRKFGGNTSKMH